MWVWVLVSVLVVCVFVSWGVSSEAWTTSLASRQTMTFCYVPQYLSKRNEETHHMGTLLHPITSQYIAHESALDSVSR